VDRVRGCSRSTAGGVPGRRPVRSGQVLSQPGTTDQQR
jgi:hypothetical protein